MPADSVSVPGLRRVWMVPLAALVAAALGLLGLTAWLEEGGRLQFQGDAALGAIGNAAEVVAAVLGIAITVVAIVVELAANRYTHRITELFVREPVNGIAMGFFVLTTLYCVWLSATVGGEAGVAPQGAVALALGMVTVSLFLLLPYFAFVFAFLQPLSIVDRIRADAFRVVRRAARGYRHGLRPRMVRSLEQLEDVALNAMDHKDQSISLAAVEALRRFLLDYGGVRDVLDPRWFEIDRSLANDPSFIAMTAQVRDDVARQHLWVEMKVLRQYHTLYVDALNRMRGIAYLVALNTHRIASTALQARQLGVFDLAVRIFNSYLRAGINVRDVRSTYYTLHHYRELAEEAMRAGEIERLVDMGSYFRYYGQLAFGEHLPFLLEAVAYDMYMLTEQAFRSESPAREALLEIFLTVDKESESKEQESSLRGVRRAQVQLATYFLEKGDLAHARTVYEDMEHERPERLASIRDELMAEESADYWEVTDRGVNFAYLPPERRARVPEFFEWFGSRVPAPRQAEDGRGPGATHPHTGAAVLREVGEAGSRGFRVG